MGSDDACQFHEVSGEEAQRLYENRRNQKGSWADDFVFVIKSTPFKINEDCRA